MSQDKKETGRKESIDPAQLRQIQELASTIRYGSITLVFQDGALIQIEKNEKIRIPRQ
ncbi:MAG: YezD family protein [Oscillospiraceae bacterium]|nr:YezD family protein [Oscillospiraceae bacterium]MCD7845649.1 YezD family protein [Oscillospiraceae bacterium]